MFSISITLSTINAFENSPKKGKQPGFYVKNPKSTCRNNKIYGKKRPLPTSIFEYFLIIRAVISVPPDDAPSLNIIAEPIEVKSMA